MHHILWWNHHYPRISLNVATLKVVKHFNREGHSELTRSWSRSSDTSENNLNRTSKTHMARDTITGSQTRLELKWENSSLQIEAVRWVIMSQVKFLSSTSTYSSDWFLTPRRMKKSDKIMVSPLTRTSPKRWTKCSDQDQVSPTWEASSPMKRSKDFGTMASLSQQNHPLGFTGASFKKTFASETHCRSSHL